jgi:intergrase/recombinase
VEIKTAFEKLGDSMKSTDDIKAGILEEFKKRSIDYTVASCSNDIKICYIKSCRPLDFLHKMVYESGFRFNTKNISDIM